MLADRGSDDRTVAGSPLARVMPIGIPAEGAEVDSSTAASFRCRGGEFEIMRATRLIALPTMELDRLRTCSGDVPKLLGLKALLKLPRCMVKAFECALSVLLAPLADGLFFPSEEKEDANTAGVECDAGICADPAEPEASAKLRPVLLCGQ